MPRTSILKRTEQILACVTMMVTLNATRYGTARESMADRQQQVTHEGGTPQKRRRESSGGGSQASGENRRRRHHNNSKHQRYHQQHNRKQHQKKQQPIVDWDDGDGWVDPFECIFRCERNVPTQQQLVLWWHSPAYDIAMRSEEALLDVLLRFKQKERGMIRDQPAWRRDKIQRACRAERVPLAVALSLRRLYIKHYNPYLGMRQLRLGAEEDIRQSASIFEECIQTFLVQNNVEFWPEEEHKAHIAEHRKPDEPYPPTPDFVLKKELLVKKCYYDKSNQKRVIEERSICWMEAKMFYGASTLPQGQQGAVGNLISMAKKYNRVYGPGAIIFMQGCGDELAARLREEAGVLVLDCSSPNINLEPVRAHQRTWCADDQGNILP